MPARDDLEYTPIQRSHKGLVHATSWPDGRKTACGIKCDGWIITSKGLACDPCKRMLGLPCKKRAR